MAIAENSPVATDRVATRRQAAPSTRASLLVDVRAPDDAEAWREFVDAYTPLVYGYCRQRGLQESDARDVTQNVFFAVSRAMRSFEYDPSRGRFRSWLGTITCREIRRHLTWINAPRRVADAGLVEFGEPNRDAASQSNLESEWESQFTAFLFRQAVQQTRPTFAPDVWRAFELTWLADRPSAEVARLLDRPVAWVYKAKFRVLTRLRESVETFAEDIPLRPK